MVLLIGDSSIRDDDNDDDDSVDNRPFVTSNGFLATTTTLFGSILTNFISGFRSGLGLASDRCFFAVVVVVA